MSRFKALVCAVALVFGTMLTLGVTMSSASAYTGDCSGTDSAYADFANGCSTTNSNDWYNQTWPLPDAPGAGTYSSWVYPTFPFVASGDSHDNGYHWQVLWVYKDGTTDTLSANRLTALDHVLRATTSIFAASSRRGVSDASAEYAHSLTPRWVTSVQGGQDLPLIDHVAIPASVWNADSGESVYASGGLDSYITQTLGYDQPQTKYLIFMQTNPFDQDGGIAYDATDSQDSINNASNGTGTAYVFGEYGDGMGAELPTLASGNNWPTNGGAWVKDSVTTSGGWMDDEDGGVGQADASVAAHEMTHSMGDYPRVNDNPDAPDHPDDCFDIECEWNSSPFSTTHETLTCTSAEWLYRFDCGRDDYWGAQGDNGTAQSGWASSWWSTDQSPYLYGSTIYSGNDSASQAQIQSRMQKAQTSTGVVVPDAARPRPRK